MIKVCKNWLKFYMFCHNEHKFLIRKWTAPWKQNETGSEQIHWTNCFFSTASLSWRWNHCKTNPDKFKLVQFLAHLPSRYSTTEMQSTRNSITQPTVPSQIYVETRDVQTVPVDFGSQAPEFTIQLKVIEKV